MHLPSRPSRRPLAAAKVCPLLYLYKSNFHCPSLLLHGASTATVACNTTSMFMKPLHKAVWRSASLGCSRHLRRQQQPPQHLSHDHTTAAAAAKAAGGDVATQSTPGELSDLLAPACAPTAGEAPCGGLCWDVNRGRRHCQRAVSQVPGVQHGVSRVSADSTVLQLATTVGKVGQCTGMSLRQLALVYPANRLLAYRAAQHKLHNHNQL